MHQCEVWRRFSELQQLSKQLEELHQRTSTLTKFPSLIKARYLGAFGLFVFSVQEVVTIPERFKESVIEERRTSAQRLFQFCATHKHLYNSHVLLNFLKVR